MPVYSTVFIYCNVAYFSVHHMTLQPTELNKMLLDISIKCAQHKVNGAIHYLQCTRTAVFTLHISGYVLTASVTRAFRARIANSGPEIKIQMKN